jgi:hypothetical protein
MGSGRGREDERPIHTVRLAAFYMDRFEVTQAEYEKLGFPNPSRFKGPDLPVEMMTWTKAALFANARSRADGLEPCYNEDTAECNFEASGYRLPTEAEWEYACRAGTESDYGFGADPARPSGSRLVRGQLLEEDPPRRQEEAEPLGPPRPSRKRRRVVQRRLREDVLWGLAPPKPPRPGRRQALRGPRRRLELFGRRLPLRSPRRREPRIRRLLPRPRLAGLPPGPPGARGAGAPCGSLRPVRLLGVTEPPG